MCVMHATSAVLNIVAYFCSFPKMTKTRAEIPNWAYRESRQKKAKGEAFLAKERQRIKRYYRATDQLSAAQLQCRRQTISERVMKHHEEQSRKR